VEVQDQQMFAQIIAFGPNAMIRCQPSSATIVMKEKQTVSFKE